jgi:hypothetical protein
MKQMKTEKVNGRTLIAYHIDGGDSGHWVGYVQIHPEDLLCAIPYDNIMILPKEVTSGYRKVSLDQHLRITFAGWSQQMPWGDEVETGWYVGFDFMDACEELQNVDAAWAECLKLLKRVEEFEK